MICHQPVYRALQDTTHDKALLTCSFSQLIFIMPGYAAHKTYRQVTASILHHIATEEVTEIVKTNEEYIEFINKTILTL